MNKNISFKSLRVESSSGTVIDRDEEIIPPGKRVSVVSFSASASVVGGDNNSWGGSIAYDQFPTVGIYKLSTGSDIALFYVCSYVLLAGRYGGSNLGETFSVEVPGMGFLLHDGLRLKLYSPALTNNNVVISVNIGCMS